MIAKVLIAILVILAVYYLFFAKCPFCGKMRCGCMTISKRDAQDITDSLAKSCSQRVRGVVRAELADPIDMRDFLSDPGNKTIIITKKSPEQLVSDIHGNSSDLDAIVMTSGGKNNTFVVMSITADKIRAEGFPTPNFDQAYQYLQNGLVTLGAKLDGATVIYIDDDIPCGQVEKCCGRRY